MLYIVQLEEKKRKMFSLKSISEGGDDVKQYTIRCTYTPSEENDAKYEMEVMECIKIIGI